MAAVSPLAVSNAGKVDLPPGQLHTSAHSYRECYEAARSAVCADCLLDERNPSIPGAYVTEQEGSVKIVSTGANQSQAQSGVDRVAVFNSQGISVLPVNTKTELPQSDLTVGLVDSQSISGTGTSTRTISIRIAG